MSVVTTSPPTYREVAACPGVQWRAPRIPACVLASGP